MSVPTRKSRPPVTSHFSPSPRRAVAAAFTRAFAGSAESALLVRSIASRTAAVLMICLLV
jgi:hypothetical protein